MKVWEKESGGRQNSKTMETIFFVIADKDLFQWKEKRGKGDEGARKWIQFFVIAKTDFFQWECEKKREWRETKKQDNGSNDVLWRQLWGRLPTLEWFSQHNTISGTKVLFFTFSFQYQYLKKWRELSANKLRCWKMACNTGTFVGQLVPPKSRNGLLLLY